MHLLKLGSPEKVCDPIPIAAMVPRCAPKPCAKGSGRAFPHRRLGVLLFKAKPALAERQAAAGIARSRKRIT
jgi:hypothetical protein